MGKIKKIREQKKIEAIMQEELRRKKKKKILLITTIVFLVIAILVVAGIYIYNSAKNKNIIKKATIETDKGNIELELYKEAAPNTVDNFIKLAKQGFYNGTKFHRVVPDFVIQGGDALGTGGPGYVFDDEINPKVLDLADDVIAALEKQGYKFNYLLKSISHLKGTISMANSGPNTNGSQFFITLNDYPDLDGRYTAFGRVVVGMDIVQKIEQDDIIKKITINN